MFPKKAPKPPAPAPATQDGKKKVSRTTMALISIPFLAYAGYIFMAPTKTVVDPANLPSGQAKKSLDLAGSASNGEIAPPVTGSADIELAPTSLGPPLSAEDTKMRGQALVVRLKAEEGCETIPPMVNDLDYSETGDLAATNKRLEQLEAIADQSDCLNS